MTVTIIRPVAGAANRYGDATVASSERIDVAGCTVAPRSSTNLNGPGRQGVLVGLSLYAPEGTAIQPDDQIEIDGVLYELDGDAGVWTSKFTTRAVGVEVALRRAVG